jgi:hypothetical protein
MNPRIGIINRTIFLVALACGLVSPASAQWKEQVLYSFQGGTDGSLPGGGLISDKAGNLYGVTVEGGSTACPPGWCGTIYKLSPPAQKGGVWAETLLYVFKGHEQNDGSSPSGGLIADAAGNLYGTASYGGSGPCILFGVATGCGAVFELSPPKRNGGAWTETVLYNFQGSTDGDLPTGALVFDEAGNLYGATQFGGGQGTSCDAFYGGNCGTIFELSPPQTKGTPWAEKVLHSFAGIDVGQTYGDGANPNGGLVLDNKGSIYGTTYIGGFNCPHNSGQGCGTVFRLKPPALASGSWTEGVLYSFKGGADGGNPAAGLTVHGGLYGASDAAVFDMTPPETGSGAWNGRLLYELGNSGYNPAGAVTFDSSGNLYDTAEYSNSFHGTVFTLKPPGVKGGLWTFNLLYGFQGPPDGGQPAARLTFDKSGNLYSTTTQGGSGTSCGFQGCGTVFEISP